MSLQVILGHEHILGPWLRQRTDAVFDQSHCWTIGVVDMDMPCRVSRIRAVALYENYTGEGGAVHAHLAGEGRRWMTRKFLWAGFDFPFNRLKVNKIVGLVPSYNEEARSLNRKLGYREEAVVEGYFPRGDMVVMTMTRDQCRWLGLKGVNHGRQGT